MQRRELLRAGMALGLPGSLVACGGGSDNTPAGPVIHSLVSDKPQYFVGEKATVTASFSGGSGRLEPGAIPVHSGVAVTVGPLRATASYRLVVSAAQNEIHRDLLLPTSYRNRFSLVQMGFARAAHRSVEVSSGRLLVVGGDGGGGAPPVGVMAYDVALGTFSLAGELRTGRTLHTATVLNDGTVLVVGGSRSLQDSPVAERFDPRTGTSRPTATQPQDSRRQHSATLLADGKVLIAGGLTPGGNAASDTVDLFDPVTEQFTRLPMKLVFKRYGHAALRVTDSTLILYGGAAISGQIAPPEVFDIPGRSSAAMSPLPFDLSPRLGAAMVRIEGGDFVALGGETVQGMPLSSVVSIAAGGIGVYPGGPMHSARMAHAAAPLVDGKILVTGGTGDPLAGPLASCEIYALPGGTTGAGASLWTARANHTATPLSNGQVLIIGGTGPSGDALSTAELYA